MARVTRVKSFRGTSKTSDGTLACSKCGGKIQKGDPYKWWANRIGRSSVKRVRCDRQECAPRPSEYSTTSPHLSALLAANENGHDALANLSIPNDDLASDVEQIVTETAEAVREVAENYAESAQNIEDGFGHSTYQSEEITEKAEQVSSQADELDSWTADADAPERDDFDSDEDYGNAVESWSEELISEAGEAIDAGTELP
jgi:hypothetical protein